MLPGKLRVFSGMQVAPTYSIKHRHYRATILHYIVRGLNREFMPRTSGILIFEYIDWKKSMARKRSSRTGRCQGCNHLERVRIERLLAAGASIKGAARKFAIDYHALRRHWRNHVSAEARAVYMAGAGPAKDQLESIVADESLALLD